MNKIARKIIRISITSFFIIVILALILYFGLWIYTTISVPNELKEQYNKNIELNISNDQYQLLWFTLTENKNYGFKWQPFFIEYFFRENKDNLNSYISFLIINSNEKYRKIYRIQNWNIEYGLSRYIKKENDYKKCLNIILSNGYMGNEIYGIVNGYEYYFNNNIEKASNEELVSLGLLIISPTRYSIGGNHSKNKIKEILENFEK